MRKKTTLNDLLNNVVKGDCLELMQLIPDCTVDMILCDLPYGTTRNKWDAIIPFKPLWEQYLRVIKYDGAIVLTAAQPFSSALVMSKPDLFRYEWVWEKTIGSGQLNINIQPLRVHESVLVFYRQQPTYNQQFTEGTPYTISRKVNFEGPGYNKQADSVKENEGYRHPKSILRFPNPRIKDGHPTQKPVELFKYMIKTYTKEGELILDNCIGSGTTAVAAIETDRNFIGMDIDSTYVKMSQKRIKDAIKLGKRELF